MLVCACVWGELCTMWGQGDLDRWASLFSHQHKPTQKLVSLWNWLKTPRRMQKTLPTEIVKSVELWPSQAGNWNSCFGSGFWNGKEINQKTFLLRIELEINPMLPIKNKSFSVIWNLRGMKRGGVAKWHLLWSPCSYVTFMDMLAQKCFITCCFIKQSH